MADKTKPDDIDADEYKRRESERGKERKGGLSEREKDVMIDLYYGRETTVTKALERSLRAKKMIQKTKGGGWALSKSGREGMIHEVEVPRGPQSEPIQQFKFVGGTDEPIRPKQQPLAESAHGKEVSDMMRPGTRAPGSRTGGRKLPPPRRYRLRKKDKGTGGLDMAAVQAAVSQGVKEGIDEGIRAAFTLTSGEFLGKVPTPPEAPSRPRPPVPAATEPTPPPRTAPASAEGATGQAPDDDLEKIVADAARSEWEAQHEVIGEWEVQAEADRVAEEEKAREAAAKKAQQPEFEDVGTSPDELAPGIRLKKAGTAAKAGAAVGSGFAGVKVMARKARQLTMGEKEATEEQEGIRKAVEQLGKSAVSTLDLVSQNFETISKAAPQVLKEIERFQNPRVQATLKKIKEGREVFPEEAKPLLNAFESLADTLEQSGVSLDASLGRLAQQQKGVLGDMKASVGEKRDAIEVVTRMAKQTELQTDEVKQLQQLVDDGFNDTGDQSERAGKLLDVIAQQAREQEKTLTGTYEDMTKLMRDQILSSKQIEKLGKQQLKSGQEFFEAFKEQGLGAIKGQGKRGALETGLAAVGLGGLGNVLEDLWDLKDVAAGAKNVVKKGATAVGRAGKGAAGAAIDAVGGDALDYAKSVDAGEHTELGGGITVTGREQAKATPSEMHDPKPAPPVQHKSGGGLIRRATESGNFFANQPPIYAGLGGILAKAGSIAAKGAGIAGRAAASHFSNLEKVSPRGVDTQPVMAQPGEFMVSKKGVENAGIDELSAINKGQSGTLKAILQQQSQTNVILGGFKREQSALMGKTLNEQGKLLHFAKIQADELEDVAEKIGKGGHGGAGGAGAAGGIMSMLAEALPVGGLLKKAGSLAKGAWNVGKNVVGRGAGLARSGASAMGGLSGVATAGLGSMVTGGLSNLYEKETDPEAYKKRMDEISEKGLIGKALEGDGFMEHASNLLDLPGNFTSVLGEGLSEAVMDATGMNAAKDERKAKLDQQEGVTAKVNALIAKGKMSEAEALLKSSMPKANDKQLNKFQRSMRDTFGEKGFFARTADALTDTSKTAESLFDPENLKKGLEGIGSWLGSVADKGKDLLSSAVSGAGELAGKVVGGGAPLDLPEIVSSAGGSVAKFLGMDYSKGDKDRLGQIKQLKGDEYKELESQAQSGGFVSPTGAGEVTKTSGFGVRNAPSAGEKLGKKGSTVHQGVDLAAAPGSPVLAPIPGTAQVSRGANDATSAVEVHGKNGLMTRHRHLSPTVKSGTEVTPGTPLGKVSMKGSDMGPHQHYEVMKDGKFINPEALLSASGIKAIGKASTISALDPAEKPSDPGGSKVKSEKDKDAAKASVPAAGEMKMAVGSDIAPAGGGAGTGVASAKAAGKPTLVAQVDEKASRLSAQQGATQRQATTAMASGASSKAPQQVPVPMGTGGTSPQKSTGARSTIDDLGLHLINSNLTD